MRIHPFLFVLLATSACHPQQKTRSDSPLAGGPCEGCEALYEFGTRSLNAVDTLPLFRETKPKLKITGTVFLRDGQTPAADVIVYIYHTNREGIYQRRGEEKGWGRRHGFIRGWTRTGNDGKYTFFTFRPGPYPGRTDPAHVHFVVKEPDVNEYYIDDVIFEDDPLVTKSFRDKLTGRGGSGIVRISKEGELEVAKRDIVLGKNIPDYLKE